VTTEHDLDAAMAEAAADVFERSYQEALPSEVRERTALSAEFDRVLAHARRTLLTWHNEKTPPKT